jgi:RNA polymerase sigma-70 factor (ECF subfamily)
VTDLATAHDELRPLMFSIAYRMLGSVAEAEDVVQDAFLRMLESARRGRAAESPEAFATTVTTRLAIDALRSARRRRERYVGTWLPEPLLDDDADPAHRVELDETVSVAFLAVLERVSPVERAVFLLREVFGLSTQPSGETAAGTRPAEPGTGNPTKPRPAEHKLTTQPSGGDHSMACLRRGRYG